MLKLFSILIFARNCWQLKSYHMSEYQLPRLFDDFGQVWIRISCNFSSSSGPCCLYLWATVHLEWKNKARSLDLNYFYFCAKLNFPSVMCYSFGIFWHLERDLQLGGEMWGFLRGDFWGLKPPFFCISVRVETASSCSLAETCSRILWIIQSSSLESISEFSVFWNIVKLIFKKDMAEEDVF